MSSIALGTGVSRFPGSASKKLPRKSELFVTLRNLAPSNISGEHSGFQLNVNAVELGDGTGIRARRQVAAWKVRRRRAEVAQGDRYREIWGVRNSVYSVQCPAGRKPLVNEENRAQTLLLPVPFRDICSHVHVLPAKEKISDCQPSRMVDRAGEGG